MNAKKTALAGGYRNESRWAALKKEEPDYD